LEPGKTEHSLPESILVVITEVVDAESVFMTRDYPLSEVA